MTDQRHATLRRAYYGDDKENPENHLIHLEGEMEFKRDLTMEEIYQTLHERAMKIGGAVTIHEGGEKIKVTCWNAMEFILYGDGMDGRLEEIKSIDTAERDNPETVTHTLEELEEKAEKTEKIVDALENASWEIEEKERERVV